MGFIEEHIQGKSNKQILFDITVCNIFGERFKEIFDSLISRNAEVLKYDYSLIVEFLMVTNTDYHYLMYIDIPSHKKSIPKIKKLYEDFLNNSIKHYKNCKDNNYFDDEKLSLVFLCIVYGMFRFIHFNQDKLITTIEWLSYEDLTKVALSYIKINPSLQIHVFVNCLMSYAYGDYKLEMTFCEYLENECNNRIQIV